jgi:DNA polymerase III subunit delta
MKPITRNDLRNQLRRREVAPVYTLFGLETYLRDVAARTIADIVFADGGFRDFNDTEFSLSTEDNLRIALAAAEQLPMMASRRVVRVSEVRVGQTSNRDTLKEDDEAVLAGYLSNPAGSAVLIFVADELNGVRRIGKLLREKTVAVEFGKLKDAELFEWARGQVKSENAEIDDRALRELVLRAGPDVRRINTEVKKLATAALPGKRITVELVDALVADVREAGNFELADRLVAGDREAAVTLLKKILDDGAEPLMLLGMLSYSFRRLLIVKEMMERGVRREETLGAMRMPPSEREKVYAAARKADQRKLAYIIGRLSDVDLAIKTSLGGGGPKAARMQIELLACEILSN